MVNERQRFVVLLLSVAVVVAALSFAVLGNDRQRGPGGSEAGGTRCIWAVTIQSRQGYYEVPCGANEPRPFDRVSLYCDRRLLRLAPKHDLTSC